MNTVSAEAINLYRKLCTLEAANRREEAWELRMKLAQLNNEQNWSMTDVAVASDGLWNLGYTNL